MGTVERYPCRPEEDQKFLALHCGSWHPRALPQGHPALRGLEQLERIEHGLLTG